MMLRRKPGLGLGWETKPRTVQTGEKREPGEPWGLGCLEEVGQRGGRHGRTTRRNYAGSPEIKYKSENDQLGLAKGFLGTLIKEVQWTGGNESPTGESARELEVRVG